MWFLVSDRDFHCPNGSEPFGDFGPSYSNVRARTLIGNIIRIVYENVVIFVVVCEVRSAHRQYNVASPGVSPAGRAARGPAGARESKAHNMPASRFIRQKYNALIVRDSTPV